ncbi:MucBP domain-containing protein [Pediococcus parvulus]|uniref:MucBP domain-containing protein n=1 Tax=Pediococcus parvulus TaxID=54062 RepID=UPI00345E3A59
MTNNKVKQNRKYALLAGTLLFSAGILGMGVTPNQVNAETTNVAVSSKNNVSSSNATQVSKNEKNSTREASQNAFNQTTEYQDINGERIADSISTSLKTGDNYSFSVPKEIKGYQVNYAKSSYTLINEDGTNTGKLTDFASAAGVVGDPSNWTTSDWKKVIAFLNTIKVNSVGENYSITITYKYDSVVPQGTFNQTTEYQDITGKKLVDSISTGLKAGENYSFKAPETVSGYQVNYAKSSYTVTNEDGTHTGSLSEFATASGITTDPSEWTASDWQTVLTYIDKTTVSENGVGKDYSIKLTYKYDAVKPTINIKPQITIEKGSSFKPENLFNSIVSSTGTTLSYAEAIANGSLVIKGPSNFDTNIAGNRGTYTFTYTDPVTGLSVSGTGVVVVKADNGGNPGTPGNPGDNGGSNGNGGSNSGQNQPNNQGNGLGQNDSGKVVNSNPSVNGQSASGSTKKNSVSANKELPQTNEANTVAGRNVGIIGLLVMATLALFGVVRKRKY